MKNIKIQSLRSDSIYRKMMEAPRDKRNDIYRYDMMKPFEKKWDCYHVPIKAAKPNGYDVIIASDMLGFLLPEVIDKSYEKSVDLMSCNHFWEACQFALKQSLNCFIEAGVELPVKEYLFTILLANPNNPYVVMNDQYCGDGGIPGYVFGWLVPNEHTLKRLPVVLAHEMNHNIRFQFETWSNDITLGEMIVSEGLAENFAVSLYGEDQLGPWVTNTDMEMLNHYIKPIMYDALQVQGMENLTAYLYGDEMAQMQNYFPVGLPYCAGYACGYHLIKYYLQKTGKSITEATLTPAFEILYDVKEFWKES